MYAIRSYYDLGDKYNYLKYEYGYGLKIGVWHHGGEVKDVMGFDAYGNVSIGVFEPNNATKFKLKVNGPIAATEVVVALKENWPDYVFSDTYKLRSLTEVENFVNQNKHLPDVPKSYNFV